MNYLVVGASAGLGRALSEALASRGHDLLLLARDPRDLDAMRTDLTLRFRNRVSICACDLAEPDKAVEKLSKALPLQLDGVFFVGGWSTASDKVGDSGENAARIFNVNLLSTVYIMRLAIPLLRRSERAIVVGVGSIAATRGRSANVAYSAAKRALESYFESLRHALGGDNIVVQLYVAGYLDTNLSYAVNTVLPKANPASFAACILRRLDRDFGRAYYPAWWRPICVVLRMLPWPLMRRVRV